MKLLKRLIIPTLCLLISGTPIFAQSENRLPMRATLHGNPSWQMSLNGNWNFSLLDEATGAKQSGKIDVPSCWETRGYGYPLYTNTT